MRLLLGILLVSALRLPAEDACPYMNAATAGGLLGGEVKGRFVSAGKDSDDGACEFIRAQQSVQAELQINVTTMTDRASQFPQYLAECKGQKTPLSAIGNEAVICTARDKQSNRVELIVGRVRDRAFIITLKTSDQALTDAGLRAKSVSAAEQVSGFLF